MQALVEHCIECGADIQISEKMLQGEIVSCPDCGNDYVVEMDENGKKTLESLDFEGDDFGE